MSLLTFLQIFLDSLCPYIVHKTQFLVSVADGFGVLPWHIILLKMTLHSLLNFYVKGTGPGGLLTPVSSSDSNPEVWALCMHFFLMLAVNSR